jgi:hypothetical protein
MIELYPVFIQEGGRMVLSVVFLAVAWWNPLGNRLMLLPMP